MNPSTRYPWAIYLATGLVTFGLKAFYSRAGVDDLAWILAPTAGVVGWVRGQVLLCDSKLGWMSADGSFVIAPACAGVNFLILVFAVAILGFTHRFHTARRRYGWFLIAAVFAYLFAIAVNSLRIAVAVELYGAEIYGGWLTPERVHRLAGTIIYLAALCLAWAGFDRVSRPPRSESAASSWAFATVPVAYVSMTVVLPLANGAWRHFGATYLEHAITVTVVAIGMCGLYLIRNLPPSRRGRLPLLSRLR